MQSIIAPSAQTTTNYIATISNLSGVSIDTDSAIAKTNSRFAAENSLIAALCYAVALAYSHFIPVNELCGDIEKEMLAASPGVKLLYQMTKDANGGILVYQIQPQYIVSTDDTVANIFVGKGTKKEHFRLVSKKY